MRAKFMQQIYDVNPNAIKATARWHVAKRCHYQL